MFQTFAHISGAHINPVTTVAACVIGETPLILLPAYFIGQFSGAAMGYGLLKVIKLI